MGISERCRSSQVTSRIGAFDVKTDAMRFSQLHRHIDIERAISQLRSGIVDGRKIDGSQTIQVLVGVLCRHISVKTIWFYKKMSGINSTIDALTTMRHEIEFSIIGGVGLCFF